MHIRKLRILFCGEFTALSTGYSTYWKEIISRVHHTNKYEVAEMASYADPTHPAIRQTPWKVYPVIPHPNNAAEYENYKQQASASFKATFGALALDQVCLDFKPDIVCDIRDKWMVEHIDESVYRDKFLFAYMPTVDALNQNTEWLDMYRRCDALFTYTRWSADVLEKESSGTLKVTGCPSPSAHSALSPYPDKMAFRKQLGLDPSIKIIGTVMRNQRRKLFPSLFRAFRKFLDKYQGNERIYLYCHTAYPDAGWNFPELLRKYNLASHTLFTYICRSCHQVSPSLFRDSVSVCPKCNQKAYFTTSVQGGASSESLKDIYNLFDLYVQYANCEGFGLPMVEAAACGVPIAAVDYSAMSDVVRKLEGHPIRVQAFYDELETGCLRAIPDENDLTNYLLEFCNLPPTIRNLQGEKARDLFLENYQWDDSAKIWMDYFDTINPQDKWESPPNYHNPAELTENILKLPNKPFTNWLIIAVLGQPEKLNTYFHMRLLRNLNQEHSAHLAGGYLQENSYLFAKPTYRPFSKQDAYNELKQIREKINAYEMLRVKQK